MIYGVSQSSGVERRLKVERGGEGVVLTLIDHVGDQELTRILVQPDELLAALTEPPASGAAVAGVSPPHGAPMTLDLDVRRNEVLLKVHGDGKELADAAVGLDDLQDALESVINRA